MNFIKLIFVFLIFNFGGLAFGNWLMNNGPTSDWYINLNQAPWTPPGWIFGLAWTIIMICFSIYLAYLFNDYFSKKLVALFSFQVFLNVIWNYIFFNQHLVTWGLIIISFLAITVFYMFIKFQMNGMKLKRILLLPYMIWLCIAISLNAYIVVMN